MNQDTATSEEILAIRVKVKPEHLEPSINFGKRMAWWATLFSGAVAAVSGHFSVKKTDTVQKWSFGAVAAIAMYGVVRFAQTLHDLHSPKYQEQAVEEATKSTGFLIKKSDFEAQAPTPEEKQKIEVLNAKDCPEMKEKLERGEMVTDWREKVRNTQPTFTSKIRVF